MRRMTQHQSDFWDFSKTENISSRDRQTNQSGETTAEIQGGKMQKPIKKCQANKKCEEVKKIKIIEEQDKDK